MSDRSWRAGLPVAYAAEKLPKLRSRWSRALGRELRRQAPIAWPRVPVTAFLGFTGFANRDEDTAEAADPAKRPRFHELGYFQVEAGPVAGPAPNPDPRAPYNAWGALAGSELVVSLLGRDATLTPGAWRGENGVPDQVAVGLANLRRHLANARAKIPAEIHPLDPASTWAVMLSFTAFSRGAGQLAAVLERYAGALSGVPERDRWRAWEGLVVDDIYAGRENIGTRPGRGGAAYAILRTRQKHECGRAAAVALGLVDEAAWYLAPDARLDEQLARIAYP